MKSCKKQCTKSFANVGETERVISVAAGAALLAYSLLKPSRAKLPLSVIGGSLAYRGISGYCSLYNLAGFSTARTDEHSGLNISKTVIVNAGAKELYTFWRHLENIPKFMNHIESVRSFDKIHSRWVARMPLGFTVSWDAEITADREGDYIAWKSLPGSELENIGSVQFTPTSTGATEVKLHLRYNPPTGKLGVAFAKFIGEDPENLIKEDLNRFKQLMELRTVFVDDNSNQSLRESDFSEQSEYH